MRTVVALRMRVDECGSDVHHVGVTVVDISSRLEGSADAVWAAVKTPVAFRRVTRGRISIDAGVFTPFVAIYARCFYAVRQRRWRTLAKELSR